MTYVMNERLSFLVTQGISRNSTELELEVRIRNFVASVCYDNNGNKTTDNPASVNLGDPGVLPYTFSDVANKFTVVGCDDLALISGTFRNKRLYSGCLSLCFNRSDVGDRSGYCQTDIPKGLTYYDIALFSLFNHTGEVSSFDPCSYAFLGDKDSFKFNDINECEDPNLNNCVNGTGYCINTPGSFQCYCNHHYDGDGKSDGLGCSEKASPFPVIKFSLGTEFRIK
ncbi:hypothetical protein Vadar_006621 [Vaccinium darrowii]|uniref:Uncharacterized protein n=1 Tax=Vaccinium darrowii TaxID=229202 RepID=A0ACB7XNN8_9ERIC|nr:hypothetical protein Vadar_006621 [Vaccinium darrowii]